MGGLWGGCGVVGGLWGGCGGVVGGLWGGCGGVVRGGWGMGMAWPIYKLPSYLHTIDKPIYKLQFKGKRERGLLPKKKQVRMSFVKDARSLFSFKLEFVNRFVNRFVNSM